MQQRRGGKRHGHGAQRSGLNLSMQHEARGASDKGAFTRLLFPRQVMHPVSAQPLHQKMPGGVKTDIIQPLTGGVIAK